MKRGGGERMTRWYDAGWVNELIPLPEPSDGEAGVFDEDSRCGSCGRRGEFVSGLCPSCLRGAS